MSYVIQVNLYHSSFQKRVFDIVVALLALCFALPLMIIVSLAILIISGYPVFFVQKRVGKKGEVFGLVKFRTMYKNADSDQEKYRGLNEADGPVFKIKNDPRFVGIGKWLSKTGLDELPQLLNVLKGEMSLVGPRPLPVHEDAKIGRQYSWRNEIRPGIFSSWIIKGTHALTFSEWMKLDKYYLECASIKFDIHIITTFFRQVLELVVQPVYAVVVVAVLLVVFLMRIR